MKREDNIEKKYSLCCGGKKCPVVTVNENEWTIADDFGGKVTLTKAQIEEFVKHPTTSDMLNG